jgi:uncharacterized protein YecE (DUF72 family)
MKSSPLQESFHFMQVPSGGAPVKPPFDPKVLFRLAAQGLFIGTSSWKYRGWEGMIYQGGYASEAQFQRVSLREYTSYFPTVGVDFTYFAWPMREMMAYLLESTPENFRLCPKVTKRITMSSFPNLPAYGKWAGQKNPDFLNAELFQDQFYEPISLLKGRLGVVLFEFHGPEVEDLRLFERFFASIPRDISYAVEIRNPELVQTSAYELLAKLNLAPVFSVWTKMPSLAEQWQAFLPALPLLDSNLPFVGLGLLKPGRSYDEAVQLFQPFQKRQEPCEQEIRAMAMLGDEAQKLGRKAFFLLNNRLEGSAPHSVGALLDSLSTIRS